MTNRGLVFICFLGCFAHAFLLLLLFIAKWDQTRMEPELTLSCHRGVDDALLHCSGAFCLALLPGFHLIPSHNSRCSFHLALSRPDAEGETGLMSSGAFTGRLWPAMWAVPFLSSQGQGSPWGPADWTPRTPGQRPPFH